MATKRPCGEDGPLPPAKKPVFTQPPLRVPPACSEEDLDIKILQVGPMFNHLWVWHPFIIIFSGSKSKIGPKTSREEPPSGAVAAESGQT